MEAWSIPISIHFHVKLFADKTKASVIPKMNFDLVNITQSKSLTVKMKF